MKELRIFDCLQLVFIRKGLSHLACETPNVNKNGSRSSRFLCGMWRLLTLQL